MTPKGVRPQAVSSSAVRARAYAGVVLRWFARILGALVLAALAVVAWAFWPVPPDFEPAPLLAAAHYDARIARDSYGVPHIRGARDADVAYGLAWAHCEDDFRTIQEVALATRGKLASVNGLDAAPIDYLAQLLGAYDDSARTSAGTSRS